MLILQSEHYQEDLKDLEDQQTDTPLPYLFKGRRVTDYEYLCYAYEYYYYLAHCLV